MCVSDGLTTLWTTYACDAPYGGVFKFYDIEPLGKGEVTKFNPVHCNNDLDVTSHPGVRRNPDMQGNKARAYATMITPQGKRPIVHRCNECSIKVDDFPIDVPIQFFQAVIATGSSTAEFCRKTGLSEEDTLLPDTMEGKGFIFPKTF